MRTFLIVFCTSVLFSLSACLEVSNPYSILPPGIWRGTLLLDPSLVTPNPKGKPLADKVNLKFLEVSRGELPFQFEVSFGAKDSLIFTFINAEERIEVRDVELWHDKRINRDSIRIHFKEYNTYLQAAYRENVMEGEWVRTDKGTSTPFVARQGQPYRFSSTARTPVANITGSWATQFNDGKDSSMAVGEFKQVEAHVTGTFRSESGDYRYLDGTMIGDKIYMSCFDGAHAYLFEAKYVGTDQIEGVFRSGKAYKSAWTAKKDANFDLRDPDDITTLKNNVPLQFSLADTEGKTFTAADLKGRVSVIQITGTWCPNCKDESNFLKQYLVKHPEQNLQVLAFAFEYADDPEKAKRRLETYKQKMGIPWPMLHAGKADKTAANALFPMLSGVSSFPTLLIVDKAGKIQHVHTGFDGPATSRYAAFELDFEQKITLLAQK